MVKRARPSWVGLDVELRDNLPFGLVFCLGWTPQSLWAPGELSVGVNWVAPQLIHIGSGAGELAFGG